MFVHRSSVVGGSVDVVGRFDDTSPVTIGLYAGSFDPPHLGHLSIIDQAARWCSTLYVVAAGNPAKPDRLFELDERRQVLMESTDHLTNVVALRDSGLVVRLAAELGADALVRGIGKEQASEFEMAVANRMMTGIPTVYVPPDPGTRWISSRQVRAEYRTGGPDAVAAMVPPPVMAALARRAVSSA